MVEMLGPLPARPPTPPRPGSRIDESETDTPDRHPTATPQTANSSRVLPSSRASKQVGWSPYLCTTVELPDPMKPLPRDSPFMQKDPKPWASPFKSILKECNASIPVLASYDDPASETGSLAMLLESVVQQLGGENIPSRRDAYMQLFNALRTYDQLPSTKDIAEKLGAITGFIQRDVSRTLANGAPLDTNLANQALKLTAAFVWNSEVIPLLSDEFKVFLLDHATTCFQEAKAPKSVLTHYMSILSAQNFGPRIMTNARVTRLLTALQDITKHVTGKAIALHRLTIYQRLLSQSKSVFISQSPLWAEHLVFGLLNQMKDSRVKAIGLGFQVAAAAGPNNTLSNTLRDLFARPLENNRKLITEIRDRMTRMMANPESGVHIPQIWSVIILLLRCKNWNLEHWEHFKEWVLVLQKCFNCSDPSIKAQAIVGWNRFIFAVHPNESTSRSLLKMLGKPILSQFERRKSDKSGSVPPPLALSSYYNFLYYTFRPSLPHSHLDVIWEEYIGTPTASTFSSAPALSDVQAHMLSNLLWNPQVKVWSEDRINDNNKIEAEDLAPIDSKWIRSRVNTVLKAFEPMLKSSVWDTNEFEKSNIARAWDSLSSALSLASSKEITPSTESMQAVASVLALLHRLWNEGPPSLNVPIEAGADDFFERFRFLSTTMISSLGSIPFTERVLLKASDGTFHSSHTPTHHKSASGTNLYSPILHLLRAVSAPSVSITPTLSYVRLVEGIIQAACNGRISRGSRLELLQQCADLHTAEPTSADSPSSPLLEVTWKASARAAADALQSFPVESARERDGSVSRDYDNVTKILAAGIKLHDVFQEWSHLLSSFVRVARTERGDQALPSLIIEPLAECLMNLPAQDTYLPSASLLSQSLSIPFLQSNEVGKAHTVVQQMGPPPFPTKFIKSIGRTLRLAYDGFSGSQSQGFAGFIESLTSFLGSGAPHFRSRLLETLQSALGPWIKDEKSKLEVNNGVDSRILTACRALTFAIVNVLQTSVNDDLTSLRMFDEIICAGLDSSHASRAKKFVDFWYSTSSNANKASSKTSIGVSLEAAVERLTVTAKPEMEAQSTLVSYLPSQRPIIDPSMRPQSESYLHLNSSPVIGFHEPPAEETSEPLEEPQLPTNAASYIDGNHASLSFPGNRREVFQMIDSIRSSSPANTPGRLGFETPVHLRGLRASQSVSGIPLTPTLAPTENEEAFIGSSPTPATRDPTPALKSDMPVLRHQDIVMDDASDIPSSPPEITARSPSPRKNNKNRNRNARRRSQKGKKALEMKLLEEQSAPSGPVIPVVNDVPESSNADVPGETKENEVTIQADERPPSRRTRSALSQNTGNDQNSFTPTPLGTPVKPAVASPAQTSTSKSAPRRKKSRTPSKFVQSENQQKQSQFTKAKETGPLPPVNDYADSSSDDLQIASQLSQDLGLAVDQGSPSLERQPTEEPASPRAINTKKRKRSEDDIPPTSAKERRRSHRLLTKPIDSIDRASPDTTQSQQEPDDNEASQSYSPEKAPFAAVAPLVIDLLDSPERTTRRSTRNSQNKQGSGVSQQSSPTKLSKSTPKSTPKQAEHSELSPSLSRRHRSFMRGEGGKFTSTRNTPRSQSTRDGHSNATQTSESQTDTKTSLRTEPEQLEAQGPFENDIPGGTLNNDSLISEIPLVSTEEATDSQVTDVPRVANPSHDDTVMQMDVNTEVIPSNDQDKPAEHVVTTATAGIQTDSIPTSKLDISDTTITASLKKLLNDMKQTTLSPDALREIDDLLFNIRVEAHDASRRLDKTA
ncbi:Rap1-interacting factor 1 N-terminal [Penicillium angulare]|uniref:Rap1-interacting factor 1 N-terminal n=1 Tax=Penicillium angulare TaxID=116970 RepID=UPI002542150A|nr:Rap1-interacting factor 1 N-terminal [Penicillium angulare]KAJ5280839.1 Rap1-interacting factor 1 N-terminal [Penicillium angulare]